MTLCFSRHMYAEVVTNQKVETWLACHRRAFEHFNGVPAKQIIDNTKCAIPRPASGTRRSSVLTESWRKATDS
jgi:transposase